jgi:flagellar motility protein MotE (MotC chaperone)
LRTVKAHANWRQAKVSVIFELRVFPLARGDEMSGRIFARFLRKLFMGLPAALLAAMTICPAASTNGQSQDQQPSDAQKQSIAEAARRSRQSAKNATKPSKVITDDDLDKEYIKPGNQGLPLDSPPKLETEPPSPDAVADAAATPTVPPDPATVPAASDDPEIARLKDSIADAEKDADLARRDLALQQDTVYSNPDYEHDIAGKAKLAALQQQINDKQQDIDRMKTRLAAMEELQKKKRAAKPGAAPAPADRSTNPNAPPPASPNP